MSKILKEKIILQSNPFQFVTENSSDEPCDAVGNKPEPEIKPKKFIVKDKSIHQRRDGNTYQIKYLERLAEVCKKNAIEYIKTPNGLELKINVVPNIADIDTTVKKAPPFRATPEAKARAQHARDMRQARLREARELALAQKQVAKAALAAEELSEDEVLFWST